ncbi:MAG: toll/interleukin-1 receptor domain-containing protein [Candidatus Sedimenticola sp. (ex Thyasira tokunagai)]
MADKEESKQEVIKGGNALVFISHDTRDAKLAEAFSSLLKSVSAGVLKSFRTSDKKGNQGIEYGVEWYPEIIKNIQEASDVVCLLTERSVNRPWILFEAGMAKGKLETPILGVALGISLKEASSGPFAQFQNCGDDEDSLTKLVFQLVDRIPNSEPDEDTIKFQVGKFKESIAEILKTNNEVTEESKELSVKDNSSAKLFEEIKVMFKDLPSRIEGNIHPEFRSRKRRRFHPMMVEEMMHMSKNNKVGILVGLGMLRDTMPWLYDVGYETLRKIDSNCSVKQKEQSLFEFHDLVKMTSGHPIMREFMDFESKDDFMMYEELPRMLMHEMERYMERNRK